MLPGCSPVCHPEQVELELLCKIGCREINEMTYARRICSALLLSLAVPVTPTSAQAAPAQVAREDDPFRQLVRAVDEAADRDVVFERSLQDVRAGLLLNDPQWKSIEAEYPGTLDRMVAAMAPSLRRHEDRMIEQLQNESSALFAKVLTTHEARDAATFYGSPLGRKLIRSIAANFTTQSLVGEAIADNGQGKITTGAVQRDLNASTAAGIAKLSAAEIAAIEQRLAGATWVAKMQTLQPQIATLRARLANAPMLPAHQAEMDRAVAAVIDQIEASGAGK